MPWQFEFYASRGMRSHWFFKNQREESEGKRSIRMASPGNANEHNGFLVHHVAVSPNAHADTINTGVAKISACSLVHAGSCPHGPVLKIGKRAAEAAQVMRHLTKLSRFAWVPRRQATEGATTIPACTEKG